MENDIENTGKNYEVITGSNNIHSNVLLKKKKKKNYFKNSISSIQSSAVVKYSHLWLLVKNTVIGIFINWLHFIHYMMGI